MRRNNDFYSLWLGALLGFAAAVMQPAYGGEGTLRVCAAASSMPLSNEKGEGFENRLAELVGRELGRSVMYVWFRGGEDPVRDGLANNRCDLVVGAPDQLAGVETTQPYYWSSYVLLSRRDRDLDITSLKDKRLRTMKIGVSAIGGDALFTPPAKVLSALGIGDRLVTYPVGPDETYSRIVEAVARGEVDIAAVWGPSAGYFVRQSPVPLTMTPIGDTDEFSSRKTHLELLGLQYEFAMGVRPGDDPLRAALNEVIARRQGEIDAVLEAFGVPLIKPAQLSAAEIH